MNDLETLQEACTPRENPIRIPHQTPPAKRKARRKPYISVTITITGIVVLSFVAFLAWYSRSPVNVAVYGEPSGAAFTIVNLDDRPITIQSFVVNGHFRLHRKYFIPPQDRCDIPCLSLEDEAGRKFLPLKISQNYHSVEVICSASGRTNFIYHGKPSLPPSPKEPEVPAWARDNPLIKEWR